MIRPHLLDPCEIYKISLPTFKYIHCYRTVVHVVSLTLSLILHAPCFIACSGVASTVSAPTLLSMSDISNGSSIQKWLLLVYSIFKVYSEIHPDTSVRYSPMGEECFSIMSVLATHTPAGDRSLNCKVHTNMCILCVGAVCYVYIHYTKYET